MGQEGWVSQSLVRVEFLTGLVPGSSHSTDYGKDDLLRKSLSGRAVR